MEEDQQTQEGNERGLGGNYNTYVYENTMWNVLLYRISMC